MCHHKCKSNFYFKVQVGFFAWTDTQQNKSAAFDIIKLFVGGHFQEISVSAEIKTKRAIIAKTAKSIILHILDLFTEYEKCINVKRH